MQVVVNTFVKHALLFAALVLFDLVNCAVASSLESRTREMIADFRSALERGSAAGRVADAYLALRARRSFEHLDGSEDAAIRRIVESTEKTFLDDVYVRVRFLGSFAVFSIEASAFGGDLMTLRYTTTQSQRCIDVFASLEEGVPRVDSISPFYSCSRDAYWHDFPPLPVAGARSCREAEAVLLRALRRKGQSRSDEAMKEFFLDRVVQLPMVDAPSMLLGVTSRCSAREGRVRFELRNPRGTPAVLRYEYTMKRSADGWRIARGRRD